MKVAVIMGSTSDLEVMSGAFGILSDFGIEISERVPIQMEATAYDLSYLQTKAERMGHMLKY